MAKKKYVLLLADDDDADLMMLSKALKGLRPELKKASTGKEALNWIRKRSFDCIIIDYMMTDYTGLELIKDIRSRQILTPIIVITGYGDETLTVEMLKAGAQDYIPKGKIEAEPGLLCHSVVNAIKVKNTENEREYYQNFYNNAPIGFYTTTLEDGTFIKANPAMVRLLGVEFSDLKNIKSTELYLDPLKRRQFIHLVEKHGEVTDFEVHIELPLTKEEKWVLITGKICKGLCQRQGKCLPNCPGFRCVEGAVIDITEKKKLVLEVERYRETETQALKKIHKSIQARLKNYDVA